MREYKWLESKVVVESRQKLDNVKCDWCGFLMEVHNEDNSYMNYVSSGFEINEFELKWKTGDSFPECGMGEEIKVDLCGECRIKLFKMLKENGCKINIKEWDY